MRWGALAVAIALSSGALLSACATILKLDPIDTVDAGDETEDAAGTSSSGKTSSGKTSSGGTTSSSASGDGGSSTSSGSTTSSTSGSTTSSTSGSTTSSTSSTAGGPVTCDNDQQCTSATTPKCNQKNVCVAKCTTETSQDGCSIGDQDQCCSGLVCVPKGTFPFTTCVKKL